MMKSIAVAAALAVSSVSGAFAYENIGAIEPPHAGVQQQVRAGYEAFASAQREVVRPNGSETVWFERATNVGNY